GPGGRRGQVLRAAGGAAAGVERVQPLWGALEDLRRCEDADPGCGELDCQWRVVEPPAQLGNLGFGLDARTCAEQLDRLWLGESRHRVDDLALDPQELPASDE